MNTEQLKALQQAHRIIATALEQEHSCKVTIKDIDDKLNKHPSGLQVKLHVDLVAKASGIDISESASVTAASLIGFLQTAAKQSKSERQTYERRIVQIHEEAKKATVETQQS